MSSSCSSGTSQIWRLSLGFAAAIAQRSTRRIPLATKTSTWVRTKSASDETAIAVDCRRTEWRSACVPSLPNQKRYLLQPCLAPVALRVRGQGHVLHSQYRSQSEVRADAHDFGCFSSRIVVAAKLGISDNQRKMTA